MSRCLSEGTQRETATAAVSFYVCHLTP